MSRGISIRRRAVAAPQYFRLKYRARTHAGRREVGVLLVSLRALGDTIAAITRRFDPGACTVRVRELTPANYAALLTARNAGE